MTETRTLPEILDVYIAARNSDSDADRWRRLSAARQAIAEMLCETTKQPVYHRGFVFTLSESGGVGIVPCFAADELAKGITND